MSRRIGVVVNPERTAVSDELVAALKKRECEVITATPESADRMQDAIAGLIAQRIDVLATVGGDGTQRTAAASLLGIGVSAS